MSAVFSGSLYCAEEPEITQLGSSVDTGAQQPSSPLKRVKQRIFLKGTDPLLRKRRLLDLYNPLKCKLMALSLSSKSYCMKRKWLWGKVDFLYLYSFYCISLFIMPLLRISPLGYVEAEPETQI